MVYDSIEEIQALCDGKATESLTLEFKASAALSKSNSSRAELVKDVTAMANSAGGTILYGVKEDRGFAASLDIPGIAIKEISPEWICQVIESNTSPSLREIRVNTIPTGVEGHVLFAINVPQSSVFAPHQNSIDQKYYRRYEGRAVPMHDYEIRDVMRRGEAPHLEVRLFFHNGETEVERYNNRAFLRVDVENSGQEPSLYSGIEIHIDARLAILSHGGWLLKPNQSIFGNYSLWQLNKRLMVPNDFPLIKGSHVSFGPPFIDLAIPHGDEGYLISCFTIAPSFAGVEHYTLCAIRDRIALRPLSDP